MNELNRIKFAFYEFFINLKKNIYIISVIAVCIIAFMYGITMYYGTEYNYITSDKLFTKGAGATGLIAINKVDPGNKYSKAFFSKAMEEGYIEAFCSVREQKQRLSVLCSKYPESTLNKSEMEKGGTNCFYTDMQIDLVINLDVYDGYNLSELRTSENAREENVKTIYYYLGYNFKDIPIGTVSEKTNKDGTINRYVVAGILQKGQRILTCYPFLQMNYTNLSSYNVVDDSVLIIMESIEQPVFFTYNSDMEFEKISKECCEITKELDCDISISCIEDNFTMAHNEKKAMYKMIKECIFMLMLAGGSVLLCTIYVEFTQAKRRYGLFYAIGMSGKDVEHIMAWKAVIEVISATIISCIVMCVVMNNFFWIEGSANYIIKDIFVNYCLIRLVIIISVLLVVYIAASIWMIRKYSISELLKRKE